MRTTALAAILTLLAACHPGSGTDPCAPWSAIRPSKADTLTPDTARQVLAHNATGQAVCGWRP